MDIFKLKYTCLHPDAKPPLRISDKAAGLNLYSAEDVEVPSGGRSVVSTGIKIELSQGCYGNSIHVGAGVIDPDYRGEVKVLLVNNGTDDFTVHKGDRVAHSSVN